MNYFTYNIYIITEKEHWDITNAIYMDYFQGYQWKLFWVSKSTRMLLWGAIQFGEVHFFEI